MAESGCTYCKRLDNWGDAGAISDCNLSDGKPCMPCKKVQNLEKEINRTKKMLDRLLSRRRVLCNRVNLSHDRMIQHFPAEILSYIFQHTLSEESNTPSAAVNTPLVLGAVCQDWRTIAWASPDLWTRVSISIEPDYTFDSLEIAHQWLRRSGKLSLSIRFFSNYRGKPIEGMGRFCSYLSSFMQEYIPRCRKLEFRCHAQFIPSFSGIAPRLESLRILSNENLPEHNMISLQALRREGICISLDGFRPTSLDIDWASVIEFKGSIYAHELFRIFQQAPRLLACKLTGFPRFHKLERNHPLFSGTITQRSITILSLNPTLEGNSNPTAVLLNMLNLPSLTHLEMSDVRPSFLERFIRRSGCNLFSFTLHSIYYTEGMELIDAFRAMLSLEELYISVDSPSVYKFFIHLSNTCVPRKDKDNWDIFLPCLRVLNIRFSVDTGFPWRVVLSIFGSPSEISDPQRRPIARLFVTYDWRIGISNSALELAQLNTVEGVDSSDFASHYLEEDITNNFLLIAESGVDIQLHDIHRRCDLLKEALEYHGISVPAWYKKSAPPTVDPVESNYSQMHEINAIEWQFDSDYSDEGTADLSEEDTDDENWEDGDGSESDLVSDKSYDCARGLPSYVTGETSELLLSDSDSEEGHSSI